MVWRKRTAVLLGMVSLNAMGAPICEVTINQLQDVDRGYQVLNMTAVRPYHQTHHCAAPKFP